MSTKNSKTKTVVVRVKPDAPKPKKKKRSRAKNAVLQRPSARSLDPYRYAAALLDPWRFRDVRIPDERTFPSLCASSMYRVTLPAVSLNGSASIYGAGLRLQLSGLGITDPIRILNTGGVANTFQWGSPTDYVNKNFLTTNAASSRIVSASISCYPSMSFMNNKGQMWMAVCDSASQIGTGDFNIGSYTVLPFARKCPIQMGHACSANYWPFSNLSFEYLPVSNTTNFGQLSVLAYGIDVNATIDVSIVVNWEMIPSAQALGSVPVKPSHCSFKALEIAHNALGADRLYATFERDVFAAQSTLTLATPDGQSDDVLSYIAAWINPGSITRGGKFVTKMYDWYTHATGGMSSSGGMPSLMG